jgi:putative addiction module component (TIGR02574 family)
MSATVSQVIEDAKSLSAKERAFLARCLISSLDATQDKNADSQWAELAKKRYEELKNGLVNSLSWDEIKKEIKV